MPGSDVFTDDITVERLVPDHGMIRLPSGPGIGVQVREDKLEEYRKLRQNA